jgi:hypothetical protein
VKSAKLADITTKPGALQARDQETSQPSRAAFVGLRFIRNRRGSGTIFASRTPLFPPKPMS